MSDQVLNPTQQNTVRVSEGLLSSETMREWSQTSFAVFGLGAGGSKAVEQFYRHGARQFFLSDPDTVEAKNTENQVYTSEHIGQTKAEALNTIITTTSSNPGELRLRYDSLGVVPENMVNVEEYIRESRIVFDGIDPDAFPASLEVHKLAKQYGKPVVVPLDIGEQASCLVYRYDLFPDMEPMRGAIRQSDIEEYTLVQELYNQGLISKGQKIGYIYRIFANVIGYHSIPEGFLDIVINPENANIIPQLGRTADTTAILVAKVAENIITGRPTQFHPTTDWDSIVSPKNINPYPVARRALKAELVRLFLNINTFQIRRIIGKNPGIGRIITEIAES